MSTLRNVFAVLEAVLAGQSAGMLFSQVCAATGLSKATVHRILKELAELGYLSFCRETRRYRGTLKLAGLGAEVVAGLDIRTQVHPYLLEMQKVSGHTCNTGVKHDDVGVYVDKIEASNPGIKLYSEIGKSFPLYCTGLGKVLLAWSPPRYSVRPVRKARMLRCGNPPAPSVRPSPPMSIPTAALTWKLP